MSTHVLKCLFCLGLAMAGGVDFLFAQESAAERNKSADDGIVVAVIDFDNVSGHALGEIGRVAHDVIATYLVGLPRVSVVTRDKLASVLKEQNLAASGLIGNQAKSTQLAALLGADFMITGSVLQYATEHRRTNAFGINTLTIFHRMKVSLQIVDLGTSKISFAKTYDLEYRDTGASHSGSGYSLSGRERDLLDKLVQLGSEDLQKALAAQSGTQSGKVITIPVTTTPAGADIELNGTYIGATPADVEIEEGNQVLRLSLQGYRVWERKIRVTPSLKVSVTLAPLVPEEKIVIEQKTNK